MVFEPNSVAAWLYTTLSSVARIREIVGRHPKKGMWQIYERVVPEGGTYPCILFVLLTAPYKRRSGGQASALKLFYEIKGVNTGESYGGVLGELPLLITQVLATAQTTTNPVVGGCSPLRIVQREDFEDNERHNHYGAEYEIWAYASE